MQMQAGARAVAVHFNDSPCVFRVIVWNEVIRKIQNSLLGSKLHSRVVVHHEILEYPKLDDALSAIALLPLQNWDRWGPLSGG